MVIKSNYNVLFQSYKGKTQFDPPRRLAALTTFANRIKNTEAVQTELQDWGLRLSSNLARIRARIFNPEPILSGGPPYKYQTTSADWNKVLR